MQQVTSGHVMVRRSLAVALVVGLGLGACAGSDPSPADARRDRVQTRLRASFSGAQARCILLRLDDTTLRALDRVRDLDPDTAAMKAYSDAVVACVTDPDGTTTSSTSSTTSPAAATTTEPGGLAPGVTTTTR